MSAENMILEPFFHELCPSSFPSLRVAQSSHWTKPANGENMCRYGMQAHLPPIPFESTFCNFQTTPVQGFISGPIQPVTDKNSPPLWNKHRTKYNAHDSPSKLNDLLRYPAHIQSNHIITSKYLVLALRQIGDPTCERSLRTGLRLRQVSRDVVRLKAVRLDMSSSVYQYRTMVYFRGILRLHRRLEIDLEIF